MLCKIYKLLSKLSNSKIPILLWSKKAPDFCPWAPSTMFWTADMCSKTQQGECFFSALQSLPRTFWCSCIIFSHRYYRLYCCHLVYLESSCSFLWRAHIKMAAVIRSAPGSFPSVFLRHLVVTTPGSDWCHQKSGIKHGSLKILKSREQCRGYAFSRSVDLFTGYLRTTATSRLVNHVQSRRRFANLAMPSVNSPTSFPWRGVLWTQLDTTETLRKNGHGTYRKPIVTYITYLYCIPLDMYYNTLCEGFFLRFHPPGLDLCPQRCWLHHRRPMDPLFCPEECYRAQAKSTDRRSLCSEKDF